MPVLTCSLGASLPARRGPRSLERGLARRTSRTNLGARERNLPMVPADAGSEDDRCATARALAAMEKRRHGRVVGWTIATVGSAYPRAAPDRPIAGTIFEPACSDGRRGESRGMKRESQPLDTGYWILDDLRFCSEVW